MPPFLRSKGTEGHCGEYAQLTLSDSPQVELPFENHRRNADHIADGYEVLRGSAKIVGLKQLASALGREPDYADNIGEGLNRKTNRFAHFDWIVPLLRHPIAGPPIVQWVCRIAGFEMPARKVPTTDAERLRALIRKCEESGAAGRAVLAEAASDLDLDVGSFKR